MVSRGSLEGVKVGAREVIGSCLGSRVGAVRRVRSGLGKRRVLGGKCPVNFIGGNMQKAEISPRRMVERSPVAASLFEKRVGALHVGVDEGAGVDDGAIDVAFGGKMHNGARAMLGERCGNRLGIADIGAHQLVALVVVERREVCGVAGVGQQVEIDDRRADRLDPAQHEVRTDESGAACNENRVLGVCHRQCVSFNVRESRGGLPCHCTQDRPFRVWARCSYSA